MATNSTVSQSIQATNAARNKLIELHREEYDTLLGDERESRGLPRTKNVDPRTKLEQKIEKLKAQQALLEKDLAEMNTPVATQ